MVRVFIGLGIVALAMLIYTFVESIQTPRHRVRVIPKAAWIAIIVLVPLLGPGLWLGFGRVRGGSEVQRRGPTAPDDDPEFLRKVEFQRRQQQRREEETRKRAEQERAAERKRQAEQNRKNNTNDDAAGSADSGEQEGGTEGSREG